MGELEQMHAVPVSTSLCSNFSTAARRSLNFLLTLTLHRTFPSIELSVCHACPRDQPGLMASVHADETAWLVAIASVADQRIEAIFLFFFRRSESTPKSEPQRRHPTRIQRKSNHAEFFWSTQGQRRPYAVPFGCAASDKVLPGSEGDLTSVLADVASS